MSFKTKVAMWLLFKSDLQGETYSKMINLWSAIKKERTEDNFNSKFYNLINKFHLRTHKIQVKHNGEIVADSDQSWYLDHAKKEFKEKVEELIYDWIRDGYEAKGTEFNFEVTFDDEVLLEKRVIKG